MRHPPDYFEFEETFPDLSRESPDTFEFSRETPIRKGSFAILAWSALLLFAFLAWRLVTLTALEGEKLARIAAQSRERELVLEAPRGIILDRNGVVLVENTADFALIFDPIAAKDWNLKDRQREIAHVASLVGVDVQTIAEEYGRYENQAEIRTIISSISREAAVALASRDTPSFLRAEAVLTRRYPEGGGAFGHVVGYVGAVSEDDLLQNPERRPNETIGKTGIEARYDNALRGTAGARKIIVDARGRRQSEAIVVPPQPGLALRLTIDSELQKVFFDALEDAMRSSRIFGAAGVALNPNDGSVLSLVSLPSFRPEAIGSGARSGSEYASLRDNPHTPFVNRAASGTYPSGSTIKPFVAAAALEENIIDPWQRLDASQGFIRVTSVYDPSISWTFRDWKPHGFVNLFEAIARSVNVYFYSIGGGYGRVRGLGNEAIAKYLREFGFGERLGIDIPGEAPGRVPTPEWKKAAIGEQWFIGDTYNLSIGQGDFSVTPLQLASATAAIANGGKLFRPRLVAAFLDSKNATAKTFEPELLSTVPVASEHLAAVRKGMRAAVAMPYGTNVSLSNLALSSAAKTGTAQFGNEGKTHALVTAFAPYENPEIVLAIVLEGGGEGTQATAVAKKILEWYGQNRI